MSCIAMRVSVSVPVSVPMSIYAMHRSITPLSSYIQNVSTRSSLLSSKFSSSAAANYCSMTWMPAICASHSSASVSVSVSISTSTSASIVAIPSTSFGHTFRRYYNVNGNEVKVGSTIKWEDKTYLVIGTSVNMKGRAHTTYNIDLKDVSSGSKISVKVRPADKIEVIEMQSVRMNFLYRQGKKLYFMDPISFDQVELDMSLAANNGGYYLIENSSVSLVRDGDKIVKIHVPEKVVCTVESTSAGKRAINDSSGKEAKLTNGLTVTVPNYIEAGQHVVMNTANDSFSGKSEVPPEPFGEK